MTTKPGDFLLLNYTLKVKESGETVDTTLDNVAKDANIHKGDAVYGPRFVILGEGWLPKGLEESLVGLDPGKQTRIELPPEKGYGARDPAKMRLVSLRRFRERDIDPVPGAQIEFDGRPAVVRAVGAGRVQVDYNHPLAGRTLVYDLSIEKVLEDENEKMLNLISRRIPEIDRNNFQVERQGKQLTIRVPEEAFDLRGLQVSKRAISSDLQKHFPNIDSVSYVETFKRTEPAVEPEAEKTPTPPKPSPEDIQAQPPAAAATVQQTGRKREPVSQKRKVTRTAKRRPRAGSENQR